MVLTTFRRASSDLIDLDLSLEPPTGVNSLSSPSTLQTSEEALLYPQASRSTVVDQSWERIEVTGNHPIWSEDRHDDIAAMDLRVGERLKNLSGDTVYVQQKLPRPGPTPVYNLEVQDEHVYFVGSNGVLAHNAGNECTKVDPSSIRFTQSSVGNTIGTPNGPQPLRKLVKDLVGDRISADELPPIRVFEKDGLMFTLDNSRLKAFQVANISMALDVK